jgi:hypothetical protein
VFNESTLVLEGVTLGEVVELMVEVLVDLSCGTVLDEKTAEDTETAHPKDLAIPCVSKSSLIAMHRAWCAFTPRSDPLVISWLHTLAYERPQYPSSYRNLGDVQFGERRLGLGHEHASAW